MRKFSAGMLAFVMLVTPLAWAGGTSPVAAASTATVPRSLHEIQRKLTDNKKEISQLQEKVGRQESTSEQAEARLRQQDQAIAELRRQLQALHGKTASDAQH